MDIISSHWEEFEIRRKAAITEALQKIPPHCQRAKCTRPPTYWYQAHLENGNYVHFYCTECRNWFGSFSPPKCEIGARWRLALL